MLLTMHQALVDLSQKNARLEGLSAAAPASVLRCSGRSPQPVFGDFHSVALDMLLKQIHFILFPCERGVKPQWVLSSDELLRYLNQRLGGR